MTLEKALEEYGEVVVVNGKSNDLEQNGYCFPLTPTTMGFEVVENLTSQDVAKGQSISGEKPVVKLIGENGNIFNLMAIASRGLRAAGQKDKATEMSNRVMSSSSYDEALCVIMDYVEVV